MPLTRTTPRIHFDVHGESGDEVVMVMGLGMRGAIWKPQTDSLARDHRILTMDHRGIGASPDAPGFPLRMRELADDVRRAIDASGFTRPHLVGVSMGGMIAQELAVTQPERFASLSLIATHPGRSLRTLPTPTAIRHFVRAAVGRGPERQQAMFALLYTPEFVASASVDALGERTRAQFDSKPGLAVLASQLSAVMRHDVSARLSRLTMPVLVVRPGRDVLVHPDGSDRIAKLVPHARVVRFDDAGHGVTFQKAATLNETLRTFFAEGRQAPRQAVTGA